jgi:hypothetical protein
MKGFASFFLGGISPLSSKKFAIRQWKSRERFADKK